MTVTVTPAPEPSTGPGDPPRIRLDVTASAGEASTTVMRLDPDGRMQPVRTIDGNPAAFSGGVALLYDYEAPLGAEVSYSSLQSPATISAPVTLAESSAWLVHVGVPALSVPVMVASLGPRARSVQRAVHTPLGRATPVVQSDGARKSAEYTPTVLTLTDDERALLEAVLSDSSPLLLNVPTGKGWGVTSEYVSVGDVTETRVVRIAAEQARYWELPCTVVDRPVGGSQSERTYVDILVDNATYAELLPKYSSYLALLAGP